MEYQYVAGIRLVPDLDYRGTISLINIGEEIRIVWERKIGRKITCTTCLEYLSGIGSTIPDDHAAFVLELLKNLPFPSSVSRRLDISERQQLIVDTVRPVFLEAGFPFGVLQITVRKPPARKRSRELPSVFVPPQHIVTQTSVDPDRFAGRCVAVTSLNPNPERQSRQQQCLESWRDIGLPVIAVNTAEEIESLRPWLPFVEFRASESVSTEYDRPTQRISALIDVGRKTAVPFMLINSDIEIRGDHRLIETALSRPSELTIGIRYNHAQSSDLEGFEREPCGLDVFLMTPELAATVPDLPFAIGKPVWDYWLPQHFRSLGHQFHWIDTPFFFHEQHPLGWTQAEWQIGARWMLDHYGIDIVSGSSEYRNSLTRQQPR